MAAETLLLVDATNLVHQAYHAWTPRMSRQKQPVNAVEGFLHLLLRLLDEHRPHGLALAFDTGQPTFRHELFADYKAQRDPTPDDLLAQLPLIREVADTFGWPALEAAGFEADDLLASLSRLGVEAGWRVALVSADRDLCQLVGERVTLHAARGRGEVDVYDPEAVVERYGVAPERLPDWKGLVGDRSDNYPGVTGIGEKTATELLQTYLTLEGVLEAGKLLPGKRGQRLRQEADQARLGRRLAQLRDDLPLEVTIAELRRREPDHAAVAALLESLDLQSVRRRLSTRLLTPPKSLSYQRVTDARLAAAVADEVEAARVVGLAWSAAGPHLAVATDLGRAWACPPDAIDIVLAPVSAGLSGAVAADLGELAAGLGAGHAALRQLKGEPRIAGWLLEPRGPDHPSPYAPSRLLNDLPPDRPPRDWGAARAWAACRAADLARRLEPRLRDGLDKAGLMSRYLRTELPLAQLWARLSEIGVPLDEAVVASLPAEAAPFRQAVESGVADGRLTVRVAPRLDTAGRLVRRAPDLAALSSGVAWAAAARAAVAAPAGQTLFVARWPDGLWPLLAELSGQRGLPPANAVPDPLDSLAAAAAEAARGDGRVTPDGWLAEAPVVVHWLEDLLGGLRVRGQVRTLGGRALRHPGYAGASPSARAEAAAEAVRWQVLGSRLERRQTACLSAVEAVGGLASVLPPLGAGLWFLAPDGAADQLRGRLAATGLAAGWSGQRWSDLTAWSR